MTIKQIAEIANVDEITIRRWIEKASDKMSGLSDKMSEAVKTKKPALFTLPETIAIIRAGGRATLADLLLENAESMGYIKERKQLSAPATDSAQAVTLPLSALTDMIAVSVVKALRPEIAKAVKKATAPTTAPAPGQLTTPAGNPVQIDSASILPTGKETWLTLFAFAERYKISMTRNAAMSMAQKTCAIMRRTKQEPFKVKDFRYGTINAYPEALLRNVFKEYYGGFIQ